MHPIKIGMVQIDRLLTAWLQVRVLPGELSSFLNDWTNGGEREFPPQSLSKKPIYYYRRGIEILADAEFILYNYSLTAQNEFTDGS